MSEAKFTSGPWQYTKCGPATKSGMGVCSMWGDWDSERVEIEANIHLIAAAPDMYAMLEECADVFGGDNDYMTGEIKELLAKARGEV